jgi:hypothetical protein
MILKRQKKDHHEKPHRKREKIANRPRADREMIAERRTKDCEKNEEKYREKINPN